MNKEKSIQLLNSLIEVNNERIESYETATIETDETDLKVLFPLFKQTSELCKSELIDEIYDLGGTPTREIKATNKLFNFLMDLKAMFSGNYRKATLNVCLHTDDEVINTYRRALKDNQENISTYQRIMINAQQRLLKTDYARIIALSNKSNKYLFMVNR